MLQRRRQQQIGSLSFATNWQKPGSQLCVLQMVCLSSFGYTCACCSSCEAHLQSIYKQQSQTQCLTQALDAIQIAGDHKVMACDSPTDCQQVLRHLGETHSSPPLWRQQRPCLHLDSAQALFDTAQPTAQGSVVVRYTQHSCVHLLCVLKLAVNCGIAQCCNRQQGHQAS